MSGSPVFVDGRLVGAVAYAFPFGKEPIAGITPIGDMIEAADNAAPRASSARLRPRPAGAAAPLDRAAVAAALQRPLRSLFPGAFRGEVLPPAVSGASLSPLALPLVFSGFEPDTFDWARGVFSAMGFAPVMGGGGATAPGPVPDLAPGAAVGVSLLEGDLDLSVTGTVTYIDQGPRLRVRPPVLQPRPDPLPPEESVGLLGLPEPAGLLEDRRGPRRRGYDGPGPGDHDLRPPRRAPAHDPRRGAPAFPPGRASARSASAWSRTSCSRRSSATCRSSPCCRATRGRSAPPRSASTPASPWPGAGRSACATSWPATSPPSRRRPCSPAPSPSSWATTSRRSRSRASSSRWTRSRPSSPRRSCGPGWTAPSPSGRGRWRRSRSSSAPTAARR